MKIAELIEKLEAIKAEHGDVLCFVQREYGESKLVMSDFTVTGNLGYSDSGHEDKPREQILIIG